MFIAYTILIFTILSISAISTNGAVEGGGIYFMSSRVLGPEFGGAIGLLFFIANVVSSALYLTGCVEGLMNNFGPNGTSSHILPGGEDLPLAYASIINVFNLVVCIFGAAVFAKTSLIIFSIVVSVALTAIMSLAFKSSFSIPISTDNHMPNISKSFEFTGLDWGTFKSNLHSNYTYDYTTGAPTDFATVFGVFFTGVTGVLAGANISGDLKNPARSIPVGTLSGIAFTFFMYAILFVLSAASCSRGLLQNNYLYLQYVNEWPAFVEIGISSATISAALTNLIGASRLLNAIASDRLFGWLLDPIAKANVHGNPIGSVLMTWFIIQLMLLIGSLNQIAQVSSILFLYTYFAINLSCMMCLLTSAPNFRPSFKYFNIITTVIGLIGSSAMTFVINPLYSSLVVVAWMLLMICIHLRSPPVEWGNISQALMFHQVRKYLLLLDHKKDHVKYWRPRILLMVENPRSCMPLIEFVNDLKKSGLFVIGHIEVGYLDNYQADPITYYYPIWLRWLEQFKVKAFFEMTMAPNVRDGMPHLARIAGLGAMKLNTIIFGFYDQTIPIDFLQGDERYKAFVEALGDVDEENAFKIRKDPRMSAMEYVGMVSDASNKLEKIVCLARHFQLFDTSKLGKKGSQLKYIDIWPVDFFNPEKPPDNCANLIMQFACVLHMVPKWKSNTKIRLLVCARHDEQEQVATRWQKQLSELRIWAQVNVVVYDLSCEHNGTVDGQAPKWSEINDHHVESINRMLVSRSEETAVSFIYLSSTPKEVEQYESYLKCFDKLTVSMPPTLLVHGNDQVISFCI
jgi:potassium/chloride transporter 9